MIIMARGIMSYLRGWLDMWMFSKRKKIKHEIRKLILFYEFTAQLKIFFGRRRRGIEQETLVSSTSSKHELNLIIMQMIC